MTVILGTTEATPPFDDSTINATNQKYSNQLCRRGVSAASKGCSVGAGQTPSTAPFQLVFLGLSQSPARLHQEPPPTRDELDTEVASLNCFKTASAMQEGWKSDDDGSRRFYRHRSTGLVQYTFPYPGDEHPEYDASSPPPDLVPEEKLVSMLNKAQDGSDGSNSDTPTTCESCQNPSGKRRSENKLTPATSIPNPALT